MKIAIQLLFIFFAATICFGQSKKEIKRQGLEAFNKEDYSTAKTKYLQLLEKGENTWETYTILGDCEYRTGNEAKALLYYQSAQKKNPIYSGLYLRVATIYRQQKNFDEALVNFRKMTITDPKNPYIYNMIASTLYEKGDYQASLDEIDIMVKLGGEDINSSFGRSLSYLKLNKIPEACIELKKADQFDKQDENREIDVMKAQFCNK